MSRDVKKASKKKSRSVRVNFRPIKRDVPVFDRGRLSPRFQDPGDYDLEQESEAAALGGVPDGWGNNN